MKVAHVVCTFPPYRGGIGNVVYKYAENLGKLGADITVFTPNYNNRKAFFSGFRLVTLDPLLKYGNGAFLPQLFWRTADFDIVHLHYPFFGGAEPMWLRKIIFSKKTRLFIHYHMDIEKLSFAAKFLSWPSNLIRDSLFNLAEAITCASFDYIQTSQIGDIYEKHKDKFYELPFGVDSERFEPDDNWQIKKNKILFVGSLDKAHDFKGLDILLSAMTLIKNQKLKLVVVGGGDLLYFYRQLAQEIKIDSRVEFVGAVKDELLPNYYNDADLLVLPSVNRHEAFGLVLLEAMSSGIPVVASNLPGVRAVFSDGVEGVLAEANNVSDLAAKIETALADEKKWRSMCQATRNLAISKYSWEKIVIKINDLYQNYSKR